VFRPSGGGWEADMGGVRSRLPRDLTPILPLTSWVELTRDPGGLLPTFSAWFPLARLAFHECSTIIYRCNKVQKL